MDLFGSIVFVHHENVLTAREDVSIQELSLTMLYTPELMALAMKGTDMIFFINKNVLQQDRHKNVTNGGVVYD